MNYNVGLKVLREYVVSRDEKVQIELATLEYRLKSNDQEKHIFGVSENVRNEHARIIYALNSVALEYCGVSFSDLCEGVQPVLQNPSSKQAVGKMDTRYEYGLTNLVMNFEGDYVVGNKDIEVRLGDNATIQGDFVVANLIKDSFNKAATADVSEELKSILKDLSIAVGKMSEQLPKVEAEQAARDLETLTTEAISNNPRRKWWELSLDGLKEAAKNVGEIGEPVLELAARIVTILSGLPAS